MLDRRYEFKFILDIDLLRKFFDIPPECKFRNEWVFTKLGSYSDSYYYDTIMIENAEKRWRSDIQTIFGVKYGNKLTSEEIKENKKYLVEVIEKIKKEAYKRIYDD